MSASLDTVAYAEKMYRLAAERFKTADEVAKALDGSLFPGKQAIMDFGKIIGEAKAYRIVGLAMHKFNVKHGIVTDNETYNGARKVTS